MAITSAYNNALSGLNAARRASTLVSENLANALTPGFGRRSLELGTNTATGGVRVLGIVRHGDPALLTNRRSADSGQASAQAFAAFFSRLETLTGTATDPQAITARLAEFETSLIAAASMPGSQQRLDQSVADAKALISAISGTADGLRDLRTQADKNIGLQVDRTNVLLADIQELNIDITSVSSSGGNTNTLLDHRQVLIDELNKMIPVNVLNRDHGQVALYSQGGAILLDGNPVELSFSPATEVMPHMTLENGFLSGLEINGDPVRTSGSRNALIGGSLEAEFAIRDDLSVSAQQDLDALTCDLIKRFDDPGLDPTLGADDAGLFTDSGSVLDSAQEIGVAGRLEINVRVDPDVGGDSWRLRAGLGATDPGEPGDGRLLQGYVDALDDGRSLASGNFGAGPMSAADVASSFMSTIIRQRSGADESLSFAVTHQTEMSRIELEQGVDTDAELQSLMAVEQAYAANARVIEALESMMDTILRL